MPDRLKEIRARLDAATPGLAEVERLRAIERHVRFPYGKPGTGAF